MVETGSLWILGVGAAVACVPVWGVICSERTYRQRIKLIDAMYMSESRAELLAARKAYKSVEYDDHMWRLFFFRDASALYPEPARSILKTLAKVEA